MEKKEITQCMWQPDEVQIKKTQLWQYMQYVNQYYDQHFPDYECLYEWSISQPELFWESILKFSPIKLHSAYQYVMSVNKEMWKTRWFVGATLNFAENLLSRRDNKTALIFHNENGERRQLSYAELYQAVASLAAKMRELKIKKGDRVAAILPNMPETIIAMLATTSIGAIWSSCSPDFGEEAIIDRFKQIEPCLLFTVDGQYFHSKKHKVLEKIPAILNHISSIQYTVIIPYIESMRMHDIVNIANAFYFTDFQIPSTHINFELIEFNDPVYILYSSGTTGIPKCIVHGAGRVLLQHMKELMLHTDINNRDIFFYYTTCGWMMWNWYVSALALGAILILYDGSPTYPTSSRLFNLIDKENISIFGTSARYLAHVEKAGLKPHLSHQLKNLRMILSTGSPLIAENFDYVYQFIKKDVCLASISGGTDIVSCFALGNPILPVYGGQLQCRGLGMAVEVYSDEGQSIQQEKGELVCTAAFPTIPLGFWNDPDHKKFFNAYFAQFNNVWAHGDYAEITAQDGLIIYGRSDAVLNPGGVRIGTAEIYRQLANINEIMDAVAVGQEWQGDERIILFVQLRENILLNNELCDRIKSQIKIHVSPRHVPAKILQVHDIPRTLNGKIVELAVREVIHRRPVKNSSVLANPEALNEFKNRKELDT